MPDIDYQRLVNSVRSARQIQMPERQYRVHAIERFRGADSPINMVEQYTRIVSRGLIAKDPRCRITTFNRKYRSDVFTASKWYNEEIQRQRMASIFQRCLFDAYIRLGVAHVALASPSDLAVRGYQATIASPLVSYVSFDDFAWDARCTDLNMAAWLAHRYRVPIEVARGMRSLGPDRKKLQAATDGRYNAEGDLRASALQMEPYYQDSEDWVELWAVYVRRHAKVVTFADQDIAGLSMGASGSPLRVQDWIGPPCGPYKFIQFNPVPDQALGNGTLTSILLLDEAINELERKLIRQAKRQKLNTLVSRANDVDNKTYKSAMDGDLVPVDDPRAFVQVTRGGPDKVNDAFVMGLRDVLNRIGGNLETLGGIARQAKTLGQEEILNGNASASLAELTTECNRFAADVCSDFLWWEWYHPTKTMSAEYEQPGTDVRAMLTLTARQRHKIPWESIGLKLDPYSMPHRSPQETLQALVGAVTKVFLPMRPLMQQAGVSINIKRFAELFAELSDMPEMGELIETAGPQLPDSSDDGSGGPADGTRTYERVSRSEATDQGQESSIRQALLGQDAGGADTTEGMAA